jgi:hypothetical protein
MIRLTFSIFYYFLIGCLSLEVAQADDHASTRDEETLLKSWQVKLEPLAQLQGEELYRKIETSLGLRVFDLEVPEAKRVEPETFDFFEAYFKAQRVRVYSASYIEAGKDLPGQFSNRPSLDRGIIIVDKKTARESLFHLLIHAIEDQSAHKDAKSRIQVELRDLFKKRDSKEAKRIVELRLALLDLDTEILKDKFLVEKSESFLISKQDLEIIKARSERNLERVTREANQLLETEGLSKDQKLQLEAMKARFKEQMETIKRLTKTEVLPSSETERKK